MKKSNHFFLKTMMLLIFLSIPSCVTAPVIMQDNLFGIVGNNADMYIYLPLAGHRALAENLMSQYADAHDVQQILDHTKVIALGSFAQEELRVCLIGSYPAGFADILFPSSKGWERKKNTAGIKYYHGDTADVSLPAHNLACLVVNPAAPARMNTLLNRLADPESPAFSERFLHTVRHDEQFNTAALYIKEARSAITALLGFQLGLSFTDLELYLQPAADPVFEEYQYSLSVKTSEIPSVITVTMLLRRLLHADIRIENNTIFIDNGRFSKAQMEALIQAAGRSNKDK